MCAIHYDLCVIGGGINGVGIARDAAGRGLSVLMVEAQDLAGATSSASTKLIHGGLRYLEHYEFLMVRQALRERETLLRTAPHLVHPISCVLPNDEKRPEWLVRLGVWLYDRLGGARSLPRARDFGAEDEIAGFLSEEHRSGLIYSDGWCDDTRLVISNAVDAASRDAKILTHTACTKLQMIEGRWSVSLQDMKNGEKLDISAAMVVNATGPWAEKFLNEVGVGAHDPDLPSLKLMKGSHIILPRQFDGDQAYVFQQPDGRIVFVAPYEGSYTLVGTTEEALDGDPRDARISDAEMTYLVSAYNRFAAKPVAQSDVIFTFSGVRPLIDDGKENASKASREYMIYHHKRYDPPLLSVFGGKLTTYRALAEDVVNTLMRLSAHNAPPWTASVALTGGDFGEESFDAFVKAQKEVYHWLDDALITRYARSYGTRMDYFLHEAEGIADLGAHYGDGVYEAEIRYLVEYEWATCAEDILWRRSKLGLHIGDETVAALEAALPQILYPEAAEEQ